MNVLSRNINEVREIAIIFVEIVRGCENGKHKVPEAGICLVHFKGKTKAIVSECSNQWREL